VAGKIRSAPVLGRDFSVLAVRARDAYASPMPFSYRIEHLGFAAADPASLADWYCRVLDGRLVWNNGATPPALFVELPGTLVLEIYPSSSRAPETGLNHVAGFRHLALRVNDLDEARQLLESRGVQFQDGVKPAGGGGRVQFFRDPEGNLLHLVDRPSDAPLARL